MLPELPRNFAGSCFSLICVFEAEFAVDAPVRKHHVEEAAGKMRNLNLIDLEFVERCVFGAMLQS